MVQYTKRMYIPWTNRRAALIKDHYGLDYFRDKSLLEIGCGHDGFLQRWYNWGCNPIVACDGRETCVDQVREKATFAEIIHHNLEDPWPFGHFDIIANMGVLYHVANPEELLKNCMLSCQDLILETEVCDSDDPSLLISVKENPAKIGHSISGKAYKPSPVWVERVLEEGGFEYEIVSGKRAKLISVAGHQYNWEHKYSGRIYSGVRRFWFARKINDNNS